MTRVRLTQAVQGAVAPWEWEGVPLRWRDAVRVAIAFDNELNTPPEQDGG